MVTALTIPPQGREAFLKMCPQKFWQAYYVAQGKKVLLPMELAKESKG